MLAKLIIWGPDRASAIARSRRALGEFRVGGVSTTIDVHKLIIDTPEFGSGEVDTGFMERLLAPAPAGARR